LSTNQSESPFDRIFELGTPLDGATEPVITLTHLILEEAIHAGVERIHMSTVGSVQWSVRAEWHEVMKVPLFASTRVINRIKIMANLQLSKRAQHGTVHVRLNERVFHWPVRTSPGADGNEEVILDCQLTR